jgi:hypothetical protein
MIKGHYWAPGRHNQQACFLAGIRGSLVCRAGHQKGKTSSPSVIALDVEYVHYRVAAGQRGDNPSSAETSCAAWVALVRAC